VTILEQLAADQADYERRIADRRRMPAEVRHHTTALQRAFLHLTELAYEGHWTREDLIRLVDSALTKGAAIHAAEDC
jgi:hypothetical protein